MDITLFQPQQQPHQQIQQHPHQQHVVIDNKDDKTIKKRIDSAIAMKSNNQLLHISLEHPLDHVYLPGEDITGTVNISQLLLSTTWKQSTARIDVHLSCSFRACDAISTASAKKQSVFKLMTNPIWISLSDTNKAAFSLTIPSHLPAYSTHDKSLKGRIEYKLKAVYEITDLPLSLYPKTSIPVLISAQISTADPDYTTPMQSEKEIIMTIPRDVALRKSTLRKGDTGLVSAKLVIPHSCFLPGESIPFTLYIQHMAPIKQAQGIHVALERITTITTPTEEKRSVTTIKTLNLPLLCSSVDDYAATVNSSQQLRIPEATAPTLETTSSNNKLIPFSIQYRLKALVNMDMHQFMEEIPQRKRDRAYNMMSKMMAVAAATHSDQQQQGVVGPAFFYSTTIELDLPIRIGTTHEPIVLPTNNHASKHHSLPYPLHIASSTSSSCQLMASPDQYINNSSIHRFDSDPTFDRQQRTTTANQPSAAVLSTTTSIDYLTLPSTTEMYDRPPSAPPLTDFMDPAPPPRYMTE